MGTWNSRGLRGSFLEELINLTNEKYKDNHLALVQKVPTPITPVKINPETKQISLAYFEQKSTVDYIGVAQGIPICFDAKECATDRFPLANVHSHQVEFMEEFERQEGIAFFLIYFKKQDVFCYMPFRYFMQFWGKQKSFHYEELPMKFQISTYSGTFVHYLEMVNEDLKERNDKDGH